MATSPLLAGALLAALLPTPVAVVRSGDDAQAARVTDAIETAFQNAPAFRLTTARFPGMVLVVVQPGSVVMQPAGGRTMITATVALAKAPSDRLQLTGTVQCYDDNLSLCGAGAVALAMRLR
jgi:hypothetical protein